jgi:hypothetical protein
MRQIRRGATLKKRGPAYICPIDKSETYYYIQGRIMRRVRVWEEDELAADENNVSEQLANEWHNWPPGIPYDED